MVKVLPRVDIQREILQRSQVPRRLGFPLPKVSHGKALQRVWAGSWRGGTCRAQLSQEGPGSWTWLSPGYICVSSLVAQADVRVKQALLRCPSSVPRLPGIRSHFSFRKHRWPVCVSMDSGL